MYNDVRKAAEVHRAVRKYIKKIAVPGVKLIDLCETLEDSVRKLIEEKGLQARLTPLPRTLAVRRRTPCVHSCFCFCFCAALCMLRAFSGSVSTGGLT